MKKTIIALSIILLLRPLMAQDIQFYNQANNSVILYEHGNFSGQTKTFGVGTYRFTSSADFNDLASSIKVPAGFVAVIYEHANEAGGYGTYVDLMEDCADLSVYGFNDKTSYLSVFSASKPGYAYVRGRMSNNQFVAGHWERARTGIDNSPPATPSALSPSAPATPSVLSVSGPTTIITSLGVQTPDAQILWEKAMNDQMGIIGNDYRKIEKIGTAAFEREFTGNNGAKVADALGLSHINFWFPQKRSIPGDNRSLYKRTLHGIVTSYAQENGADWLPDYDVHVNIKPSPKFEYLLKDAALPNLSKLTEIGQKIKGETVGCPSVFTTVEAEIAPDYWPKGDRLFARSVFADMCLKRVGAEMCVYGPWIYDAGHCDQPEIHPAEQFWWNENVSGGKKYSLNVFCDASRRFWWRDQMDDGVKLKPWGAPPIKGVFAIAFEIILGAETAVNQVSKKFEASYIDHYNLIEYPGADQTYKLMYQNQVLVSFIPHNNAFKVSFENVGKVGNKVRGFLVIETSVGKCTQIATSISVNGANNINIPAGTSPEAVPESIERQVFKKEEGYYLFSILETNVTVRPANNAGAGVKEKQ